MNETVADIQGSAKKVQRIHHIDFVVRDLERATELYRKILGTEPLDRETLPSRGIDLVRFQVGETWIILVQPLGKEGPVAEFLRQHGEGFFHIAYQVDGDVEAVGQSLAADGVGVVNPEPRLGVEGWKLVDLEMEDTLGAMIQLVEPTKA